MTKTNQTKFDPLTRTHWNKYHDRTVNGLHVNLHQKYVKFSPASFNTNVDGQPPMVEIYRAIAAASKESVAKDGSRNLPIGLSSHQVSFKFVPAMITGQYDAVRVLLTINKSNLESLNALLDGATQRTFDIGRIPFANPTMFKELSGFLNEYPDGKIVSVFQHVRTKEPRVYVMVPTTDNVIGRVKPFNIDLDFGEDKTKPINREILDIEL